MTNDDFRTLVNQMGNNTEALGFVLGWMLTRKPGSITEAIDVLNQLHKSLPDMPEGLVSAASIGGVATCLKVGLSQAQAVS